MYNIFTQTGWYTAGAATVDEEAGVFTLASHSIFDVTTSGVLKNYSLPTGVGPGKFTASVKIDVYGTEESSFTKLYLLITTEYGISDFIEMWDINVDGVTGTKTLEIDRQVFSGPSTVELSVSKYDYAQVDPGDYEGKICDVTITADTSIPPETVPSTKSTLVHELEKGWSFDGRYIPHYVELNWYFGDNPVDYRELYQVRVHGLSKGKINLEVSSNGMQTDYLEDYSEAQILNLPHHEAVVTSEYLPVTNYAEPRNRGLSTQLKFEGSNQDVDKPEPSHVLQVLVIQSSPQGNGNRSN